MHLHHITRLRIGRHFDGALGAEGQRRLFRELDDCDQCAHTYRRHNTLEGALGGDSQEFSHFCLDRIESVLFERIDLAAPSAARKFSGFSLRGWVSASSGMAVLIALGLFFVLHRGTPPSHRVSIGPDASLISAQFQSRGGGFGLTSQFGIRVFVVLAADDQLKEQRGVGIDDIITFTYTRALEGPGYLTLFGLQKSDGPLWYYPDYDGAQSIPIKGDMIDETLGDGIDLSVNHQPGTLHLVALFTDEPIASEAITSKIQQWTIDDLEMDRLPTRLLDGIGENAAGFLIELTIEGHEQ